MRIHADLPLVNEKKVGEPLRSWDEYAPFYEIDYSCRSCIKSFSKFSELRSHVFIKHVCIPCDKYFDSAKELDIHTSAEHSTGIRCNKCEAVPHSNSVESFIHHSLLHQSVFCPITCRCSSPPPAFQSIEKHLWLMVNKEANHIFRQKKDATMELRWEVEIAPPKIFTEEVTLYVSHSMHVTKCKDCNEKVGNSMKNYGMVKEKVSSWNHQNCSAMVWLKQIYLPSIMKMSAIWRLLIQKICAV